MACCKKTRWVQIAVHFMVWVSLILQVHAGRMVHDNFVAHSTSCAPNVLVTFWSDTNHTRRWVPKYNRVITSQRCAFKGVLPKSWGIS